MIQEILHERTGQEKSTTRGQSTIFERCKKQRTSGLVEHLRLEDKTTKGVDCFSLEDIEKPWLQSFRRS
jgi:hypothetical protein